MYITCSYCGSQMEKWDEVECDDGEVFVSCPNCPNTTFVDKELIGEIE